MCFKKQDVLDMAQAIIDVEPLLYDGDYGPPEWECHFCSGYSTIIGVDIKHETTCVTLIARDILT